MLVVFTRSVILYFLVFVVMRIMGKSEISQFQPFEFVIAILLADLASVPMQNPGMSLLNGVVSIIALLIVHVIISRISIKSKKMNKITSGKPAILINRGKINMEEMEKQQMTVLELQERLRQNNYPYLEDIYYAILENSGEISVIEREQKIKIKNMEGERGIQTTVIVNEEIDEDNLKRIGKNKKWIDNVLKQYSQKQSDILLLCVDELDNIFFFSKEVSK